MRPTVKDSAKNEDKEKEILMRPMVNVWYKEKEIFSYSCIVENSAQCKHAFHII